MELKISEYRLWDAMVKRLFFAALLLCVSTLAFANTEFRTQSVVADSNTLFYKNYTQIEISYSVLISSLDAQGIDYTVDETKLASSSSSSCAHAPICVIVLPFILLDIITRPKMYDVDFSIGKRDYSLRYFQKSGLLYGGVFNETAESSVYSDYFNELKLGYVYDEQSYAAFKTQFLNDITTAIIQDNELDAAKLASELMYVERDSDVVIRKHLLHLNNPKAQNKFIQSTCYELVTSEYNDEVDQLIALSNVDVNRALLKCLSQQAQTTTISKGAVKQLVSEFIGQFCSEPNGKLDDLLFLRDLSQGIDYSLDLHAQSCEQPAAQAAIDYMLEKQISIDQYLLIHNEFEGGLAYLEKAFTERHESYAENVSFRLILATKHNHFWVRGTNSPALYSLSHDSLHKFVFQNFQLDSADYLIDYYIETLSEQRKNFLGQIKNKNVRRQADLLERISRLDDLTKEGILERVIQRFGDNWSIPSYALAIALNIEYKPKIMNQLSQQYEYRIRYVTNSKSISSKVDANGTPSAELLVFSTYLIGVEEQQIKSMFGIK